LREYRIAIAALAGELEKLVCAIRFGLWTKNATRGVGGFTTEAAFFKNRNTDAAFRQHPRRHQTNHTATNYYNIANFS
jgi:hypothetical protein